MISKGNPHFKPTLLWRFVFTAVGVVFFLSMGISVQAAIDEAMPANVPAEVAADWKDQGGTAAEIKASLPADLAEKCDGSFESACHWRRVARMRDYPELENIMFCRHHNFGGILVGYHDNVQSSESDQSWSSNSALCVLNLKNYYSTFSEILKKTDAVVRDPCISIDGKKVVFAISGKGKGTGYKIYEMEIANPSTLKQLTTEPAGVGVVADFEPCYMPNGDIMFTSSRNFGLTDCAFNPTVNMFLMDSVGKYIRQVGFDQVHTFYPVMRDDGTVLYTRWEYNDRDITNTMGLFTMNPDGAHQTEFFGNQTSWPFTMLHARPIPNSGSKVIAVAGGHHGPYAGELMIIDNQKGYNGTQSIQMIAPKRATKPDAQKSDISMGGVYFTFQNPYPLDDDHFLVSWRKSESEKNYRLYFMDVDGNRELLAWADQSVSQPVLIQSRKKPFGIAAKANYNDSMGYYTMQDVNYKSDAMKDIEKGAAKTLRVVALSYRMQGAGNGYGSVMGSAPSGLFAPAIFCPVSVWGASWEAKTVLGEAKIYDDGSAAFKVPARTPVFFQVLDSMGYCIAHMRSWSTLMPGETFSCVGCHESKLEAPPTVSSPQAGTPKPLDTPLGIENKPFDFGKMVAPILQDKCASCHKSGHTSGFDLRSVAGSGGGRSWTQSYISLMKGIGNKNSNKAVNICYIFTQSEQQPPRSFGACKSGMMENIESGHKEVKLTEKEKKIVACWIDLAAPHGGTYSDYLSNASGYKKLEEKRTKWAAIEAEGLKELAKLQTAVTPDDHGSVKSIRSIIKQLDIGYVPTLRALVLKNISKGNFMLVDLRGKVISRMELSDLHTGGNVTISLPASLGTGLYLARFEGVNGTRQAKISIIR